MPKLDVETLQHFGLEGGLWAIKPGVLDRMISQLRGLTLADIEAFEAKVAGFEGYSGKYSNIGGKAVIPIEGVITKKPSLYGMLYGKGTSTQLTAQAVKAAIVDPDVESIVFRVDSPGGTVDGTEELANLIFGFRDTKPMGAFADGLMASAAYWISSAAGPITISGETVEVGSIGVIYTHMDISKLLEDLGVKITHITGGKYKAVGSPYQPLTAEDTKVLQAEIDKLYSVFTGSVAKFRGVPESKVLSDMADGRIFIGSQAIDAGLADNISPWESMIAGEAKDKSTFGKKEEDTMSMNLEVLKKDHPEVYQAALNEGKLQGYADGAADGKKEMQSKVDEISAENKKLKDENAALDRQVTILEAKSEEAVANSIMDAVLSESALAERFHAKVKKGVDYNDHRVEGEKFTTNSESAKAFKGAFEKEVQDWEKDLAGSVGSVLGEGKEHSEGEDVDEKKDAEYGRELARQASGAIRSDQ